MMPRSDNPIDQSTLILLRHGQSTANAAGLFTGVHDAPLTAVGIAEAHAAAALLIAADEIPDVIFTSELIRARHTAQTVAIDLRRPSMPIPVDWRLNERNYGALTGRSKAEVFAEYGEAQFVAWRRSVDVAPPPLSDAAYAALARAEPFSHLPAPALARTESLRDVITRVNDFWEHSLLPVLARHVKVAVVAHGNSLRALCAVLDTLSASEVQELNIPTGQPLLYELGADRRPLRRGGNYLDDSSARAAALALASEGGT